MPFALPDTFVLYDLEWTSWDGAAKRHWSGPNEYREVVQIGAIRVDGRTLEELDSLTLFVRPRMNHRLSVYFMELTGISQENVDRDGVLFPEALVAFARFCDSHPAYSWGWDYAVLFENAALNGMWVYPMAPVQFADIRRLFHVHSVPAQDYMSSTIPRYFGVEPPAHAHNALSDARSILMALRALRERESLPT